MKPCKLEIVKVKMVALDINQAPAKPFEREDVEVYEAALRTQSAITEYAKQTATLHK